MTTLKELIQALEAKGINYEINNITEWNGDFNCEGKKIYVETGKVQISFEASNLLWAHFYTYGLDDDEYLFFIERYSMRTGKATRGYKMELHVLKQLGLKTI